MKSSIEIDRDAIYLISEAAEGCSLSTTVLASAIKSGVLPATMRGRKTFIEGAALRQWLVGNEELEGRSDG